MTRIESLALGVAAGALVVGWFGPVKVIIAGVAVAAVAYAWRRFVAPRPGF